MEQFCCLSDVSQCEHGYSRQIPVPGKGYFVNTRDLKSEEVDKLAEAACRRKMYTNDAWIGINDPRNLSCGRLRRRDSI